jgi:hypothetical protein
MSGQWRISGTVVFAVLMVGLVANRSAVRGPLALDDFAQRAMIEGKAAPPRGPFNLYDFISDDNRAALLARGAIPWWSDPRLKMRFLRPLPSALVWLDHRLFGYQSLGPHMISVAWWIAAVLAACFLYRTVMGARAALIATAAFALSPTLAIPLVWLANRDALVTLTFGALALALYLRWRARRSRVLGLAATAAFGAAALTGEYAICLAAYVVACEIGRLQESFGRRLLGVVPAALPLGIYTVVHLALGYGANASGFYRDPIGDPIGYLRALPRATSVLIASSWVAIDESSALLTSRPFSAALIVGGAIIVAASSWAMRRRDLLVDAGGAAAWLACGSVLALLPLAATEPSRRILGIAALGVSGVLGILIERGREGLARQPRPTAFIDLGAVLLLGYVHFIAAPSETRRISREAVDATSGSITRFASLRGASHAEMGVVVRANHPPTLLWTPFMLRADAPEQWRVLSQTFERTTVIRTSPSALEVAAENGPLFAVGPTELLRTTPFNVGTVVQVPGLRATVLRVDEEGQPKAVRYDVDRDLDGRSIVWISEGQTGFREAHPPPVGFGMRLDP